MIKQTAMLVADSHKVDLTNPDKVIIVEVFQVSHSPLRAARRVSTQRDVAFPEFSFFRLGHQLTAA